MKKTEKFTGSLKDFDGFLATVAQKLRSHSLLIEGEPVVFPQGEELEFSIKFDDNEEKTQLSIKCKFDKKEDVEENVDEE